MLLASWMTVKGSLAPVPGPRYVVPYPRGGSMDRAFGALREFPEALLLRLRRDVWKGRTP